MAWQVYWIVIVLVLHQARDGCHGAPLGDSSAEGAGHSFMALDLDLSLDQGAQRDFDLFYPELEETTPTTPTTAEDETSYAVPVIHLPAEETDDDIEKVAADAILSMFPQDLLENNKKVRPVDVKIIEHDGYIDYEIEFIELAEYYDDYSSDTQDTATEKPASLEVLSGPELTFVDLLMAARKQHRKKEDKTEEAAPSSTPGLRETVKSPIEEQKMEENPNKRRKDNKNNKNKSSSSSRSSNTGEELLVSDSTVRSEPPPATETESLVNTVTPEDDQTRSTAEPTTTISPPQLEVPRSSDTKQHRNKENIQIADKEESVATASVQKPDDAFDQFTEDFQISESRSRLSVFTSETPETTETNYDYYQVEFTTNSEFQDDFSKPERRPKVIRNEKHDDDERQNILIKNLETKDQTEATTAEGGLKGYYQHDATGDIAEPYVHDQRGQYKEIHPGQYAEIHPGQYGETHPGQYKEVNPGQYTLDDKDIEVDVNNRDNESRIYNVRANAGDFIIGEAGRIDINSGQTLEGVRYTAVESEVDYEKIKEILARYFGAR